MNLLIRLEKVKELWPFLGILTLFILLRIPSLIEPYWYGDEGIYHVIGDALRQGKLLYQDIWDNKPPLLYLLYALGQSDQFIIHLISLLFGLGSVIVFFALTIKLFTKSSARILSATFYAILFATPFLEGNIANAENFMHLPILLAALFLLTRKGNDHRTLLLAGLLLGIAFLFKFVAIFDFLAFLVFILLLETKQRFSFEHVYQVIKTHSALVVGFLLPLMLTIVYFLLQGALTDFVSAVFTNNINYVGYNNQIWIPQGLLFFKLLVLGVAIFLLGKHRKSLPTPFLFTCIWFLFSLFNAFFSHRPYTHYLLVLLPSFCLFLGMLIENQTRYRKYLLAFFVLCTLYISQFFSLPSLQKTALYYQNYLSFVSDKKSVEQYQGFFDKDTPRDYEVAYYLKNSTRGKDS
ncbi:MAG TPA: glycosyltransferase family 39 protein, partial [Patescibacteria group bacterium]|nr:glycosyltransferase family 39 protein [Patescibacteria group bacterium]